MRVSLILSAYFSRVFASAVFGMLAALAAVVGLFDFIELLRRSATKPDATFAIVSEIAALRLPWVAMQILPFGVLLGGMIAFWRLTRSSELVVARAAGVSAWQFLTAPTLCAVLLGAVATGGVGPISALMRGRAEQLENLYLKTGGGPLALNGGSFWLRQSDHQIDPQGIAMLHANGVAMRDGVLTTQALSVFRLDGRDRLLERIEASEARLEGDAWLLTDARRITPDHLPDAAQTIRLPTAMTVERVQDSFAAPDTFSVWALPPFIALLERSGFSSIRHRLQFHTLLALPLLAGTMALLAAGFSMRPARRGGVARMIGSGVAAGFALFVVTKVAEEFGQSGALPPLLAAWAPAAAGLMLAVALLLHLEDG